MLERAEVDRRRDGRVDDDGRRVRGRGVEVGHRQERVRRRLEPDEVDAVGRRAGLVELDDVERPSGSSARRAGPCRSTRRRRARPSARARAARARAQSSRPRRTGTAARARRRARPAPARPRRRSDGRSAGRRSRPCSPRSSYGQIVERSRLTPADSTSKPWPGSDPSHVPHRRSAPRQASAAPARRTARSRAGVRPRPRRDGQASRRGAAVRTAK